MNKQTWLKLSLVPALVAPVVLAISCGGTDANGTNDYDKYNPENPANWDSIAEKSGNIFNDFTVKQLTTSQDLTNLNYLIPNEKPLSDIKNPNYFVLDNENGKFDQKIKNFENSHKFPVMKIDDTYSDWKKNVRDEILFLESSFWDKFPELRYCEMGETVLNADTNELNNLPLKLKYFSVYTFVKKINLFKNINIEFLSINSGGVEEVILPPNLKKIIHLHGGKFKTIDLPNTLEMIGDSQNRKPAAFANGSLTSINIPNSVTYISGFHNISYDASNIDMDTSVPWDANYDEDIYIYGSFAKNPLTHIRAPRRFESYFKSELFLSTIPTRATLEAPGNMEFY